MCEKQNLGWGMYYDDQKRNSIYVECKTCKTRVNIPYEKCVARVICEKPYPATEAALSAATAAEKDRQFLKEYGIDQDLNPETESP